MAIEQAGIRVVRKPWGSTDLRPWRDSHDDGGAIGELWFERADAAAPASALLLKLLFTTEPLSIQVHPDDAFAQSKGMRHGKTEAWYILSALPGAKIALGLKWELSAAQLRAAITDGSIAELVQWRGVVKDEVVFVPAGTIHAIGAGLVVAEIQQRSDTTFRLFDYGRKRPLHVDDAVAVAKAGPLKTQGGPKRLSEARTLLVASPPFVLERLDLMPHSHWEMEAAGETWMLLLEGHAGLGPMDAVAGDGFFVDTGRTSLDVGRDGVRMLVAYPGADSRPDLLRRVAAPVGLPARPVPPRLPARPAASRP